jgi:transposase
MLTHSNIASLKDEKDLQTISALTHGEMRNLLNKQVIAMDLFDERSICEVTDPAEPMRRYCLCRNPQTAHNEHDTRKRLLKLTTDALADIAAYKRAATVETLGARVGKILAKYKVGKFIQWSIDADPDRAKSSQHRLVWSIDMDKVAEEQQFDGCYIIASDVDQDAMNTLEVVNAYKSLTFVERAFRSLKTVQLEIRPVYHKTDERIRSHVFLCMLSYYLQWHMEQRLAPLFAADGQGSERRWTFHGVIECLAQITRNRVAVNGVEFDQNSMLTPEQEEILGLLQIAM